MNNARNVVAVDSLDKGRFYLSMNHYGRAFAHFLVYLELSPDERESVVNEFTYILHNWTNLLESLDQYEDLIKCYLQGIHYFPRNVEIINNFGAHLIRMNQFAEAKEYLSRAIDIDPDYLPAEKNHMTANLNLVPRWHFRMLNDAKRNEAYRSAILKNIDDEHSTVLDIGTGTGLLSLYAASSGYKCKIYAVEESTALYKVAREVVRRANRNRDDVDGRIEIVYGNSTDLKSLPRCDLLIMEIFDAALFGERVLHTLVHAHRNLLSNKSRIVPRSASVYVAGIECPSLYKRYRYSNTCNALKLGDLCLTRAKDDDEPYEAENLNFYGFKMMTETREVFVDFHDSDRLERLHSDPNAFDTITLKCLRPDRRDHQVQAIVVWFDLNLCDGVRVSTNPFDAGSNNCWDQAIFYLDHPITANDVQLKLSMANDKFEINVLNASECTKCLKASRDVITFLNDSNLINAICDSTKYLLIDDDRPGEEASVLDMNPLPLFIWALGERHDVNGNCLIRHECDAQFVRTVCNMNGFARMRFWSESQIELLLKNPVKQFDVVFLDPVANEGIVNEKQVADIVRYRGLLVENGKLLPENVCVTLKLIESDLLQRYNKVNDENCGNGYKVSDIINEFSVMEQWMVRPYELKHKSLTDSQPTANIIRDDSEPIIEHYDLNLTASGKTAGILYWYRINYINDVMLDTYNSLHYNSACFILDDGYVDAAERKTYEIRVKQHKGLLKIY